MDRFIVFLSIKLESRSQVFAETQTFHACIPPPPPSPQKKIQMGGMGRTPQHQKKKRREAGYSN